MSRVTVQAVGRIVLLRWQDPLTAEAPHPEDLIRFAAARKARLLVLDTLSAPYADSDGLRWLFKIREQPIPYRIVARPGGKIWKALKIFGLDQELYASFQSAWRTPWNLHPSSNSFNRLALRTALP